MRSLLLVAIAAVTPIFTLGQKLQKDIERKLKTHVDILSSDSLEGRRAGTIGEKRAAEYISRHFKTIGLSSLINEGSFTQPFDISDGDKLDESSIITLNNHKLDINKVIFLPFSLKKASFSGTTFQGLRERDGYWLVDIKENLNGLHPHTDIFNELKSFTEKAILNGCRGILFHNAPDFLIPNLTKQPFTSDLGITALYTHHNVNSLINPENAVKINFNFSHSKRFRNSNNVIGFLNNRSDTTIIIGAHYDHLGYGEDGNSMLRNGPLQVHNGADDNASGTSALLELANQIVKNKKLYNNYNFIFAAFSGEELGLLGSKFFADRLNKEHGHIKYMINLDMVGRLNPLTTSITIGGYGTSPSWGSIFTVLNSKELSIKFDSTGSGPSDHTTFYRKNIPVLFYFTGIHQDYHKPSDDSDKINLGGIKLIIKNILKLIRISSYYPVNFTKTRDVTTSTTSRFTVSLGIMPDYSFNGIGVRIDGTSDGKIAQQIGLLSGDIIVRLGENDISSVESYMKALSKFKKGDKTEIEVKRDSVIIIKSVLF